MTNDELFTLLLDWSEQEDSYSVKDFAKQVEVPYKTIKALSEENEDWEYKFDVARGLLACNAEKAMNANRISGDDGIRYIYENDFFIKEDLRERDEIVPEDEEEFDLWLENKKAEIFK
jgi:hypothetical protein